MPDQDKPADSTGSEGASSSGSSSAAVKEKPSVKPSPVRKPPAHLPPWKVLLHNDDVNDMQHVIDTLLELTPLNQKDAELRTVEANDTGVALILQYVADLLHELPPPSFP